MFKSFEEIEAALPVSDLEQKPKTKFVSFENLERANPVGIYYKETDVEKTGGVGLFTVPKEKEAEWKERGEIGMFESFQRLDKTEMIPFWGGAESAYKSFDLMQAVERVQSDNYDRPSEINPMFGPLTTGLPGLASAAVEKIVPESMKPKKEVPQKAADIEKIANFLYRQEEERVRGKTFMGQVTEGVAVTLPFMAEFIATGGLANIAKAGALKGLKLALKAGTNKMLARTRTRVLGSLAVGGARTLLNPQNIMSDAASKRLQSNFELTDKGVQMMEDAKMGWATALAKGVSNTLIDQWSESQGQFLVSGLAARLVPKNLRKGFEKIWKKLHPNESLRKLYSKTGYNSFIGEMGEEILEDFFKAVTGSEDFNSDNPNRMMDRIIHAFADPEKWLVTAAVIAIQGGAGQVFERVGDKITKDKSKALTSEKLDAIVEAIKGKLEAEEKTKGEVSGEAKANIPLTPEVKTEKESEEDKEIIDALDKFNEGDDTISTVADVSNIVGDMLAEKEANETLTDNDYKLQKALEKYRKEQEYDRKLKGRGDMDSADDKFLSAIERWKSNRETLKTEKEKEGAEVAKGEKPPVKAGEVAKTPIVEGKVKKESKSAVTNILANLQEKRVTLETMEEKKQALRDALNEINERRKQFIRKIRSYKGGVEAEEYQNLPNIYKSKNGMPLDEVLLDAQNAGLNLDNTSEFIQYLQELEANKKRLENQIAELKQPEVTVKVISNLRQRVRDIWTGIKGGKVEQKKETKKVQSELIDMIKSYDLELKDKGKLLTLVKSIQTEKQWEDNAPEIIARLENMEEAFERRELTRRIKRLISKVKDAQNIAIEYKKKIWDLLKDFDLKKRKEDFIETLKNTADWIEAQRKAGEDVDLPQYVFDDLKILGRINIENISNEDLKTIVDSIELLVKLGKTKLKARKAIVASEKERIVEEVVEDARKLDSKQMQREKKVGGELTVKQKFQNLFNKEVDITNLRNKARQPVDHMFLMISKSLHRNIKMLLDRRYRAFLDALDSIKKKSRELAESLDLKIYNFKRIGIHAANEQQNGRAKLLRRYSEEEIDSVVLDAKEMQYYDFMRSELDKIRPEYEKMLQDVFNVPLAEVENYFPFMTDYTEFEGWTRESGKFNHMEHYQKALRKKVNLDPSKRRTDTGGNQNIKIDASEVFIDHMENVLYAIHMARDIQMTQEIANTDEFKEIVGDIGQKVIQEWLDLVARMGRLGRKKEEWESSVDYMRKALGAKSLILNPASIIMQITAAMDGAGLIGHYAFIFQGEAWNPFSAWRKFALKNDGKLRARVGDDFSLGEHSENWFDELRNKGYTPQRIVDSVTAIGVWLGAYNKYCDDHGIKADVNNPNQAAIDEASRIMVMTQASSSFMDAPLALTKGLGVGDNVTLAKAVFQFQTPLFSRFSNLVDVGGREWNEGSKKLAMQIFAWNVAATVSELAIRYGVKTLTAMAFMALFGASGDPEDDEEKNQIWEWFKKYVDVGIGNIPYVNLAASVLNYGSIPIPVISIWQQALETFKWWKKSKNPDKQFKWATILALQVSGIFTGLPPTIISKAVQASFTDSKGKDPWS